MDARFEFVYIIAVVFCMANTLVLLSKLNYNVGSVLEIKRFSYMSFAYMAYLALEFVWILSIGDISVIDARIGSIAKIVDTMLIPLMVYFWLIFAATRFKARWVNRRVPRLIAFIPIVVMTAIYAISMKTGIVFSIDSEGGLVEGPLVALTGIVDNIYGIGVIIYATVLLIKEKAAFRKQEYITQIVFILICTAGGMIDAAVTMTPVMPLAISLSFIYLFTNILEGQIFNDALTGLNNRRRADDYLSDSIADSDPDDPTYVFIMDIDRFKGINDTYGHLEGDRALVTVADGLKTISDRHKGLISRWGGDEFIVVIRGRGGLDPEAFLSEVDEAVRKQAEAADLPYEVRVSTGYAKCENKDANEKDLIHEADQMMYDRKSKAENA